MPPMHSPKQNHLLAALPAAELDLLAADLQQVPMPLGKMLYEPGHPPLHAWFPTTAVVSLHYVTASGAAAETTGVGREGVVGVPLFLGGNFTTGSAVVQSGGHGYRLERSVLLQAFAHAGSLQRGLLRYTQALATQVAQTVGCYRHHSVEQQLSRWLLSTSDRLPAGELVMTQELVAALLGVRRESITEAAGRLRDAGFIGYRRGHISILDAVGLQTYACECYGVVKKELVRLLPRLEASQGPAPPSTAA